MWIPATVLALPLGGSVVAAVADSSNTFDPYTLIGTGPAAAVAVLFMLGKLHGQAEVNDLKAERDALRADRDEERKARIVLQNNLIEQVVPALTLSTEAVKRLAGDG